MTSHRHIAGASRRAVLGLAALLAVLACVSGLPLAHPARAQTATPDPLSSWNDGPTKQAIIDFVRVTTDPASPDFVAPEDRIATFDLDGTLWVEHPLYTQVVYALDRAPALVKAKPELAAREPFKTVLSGDRAAIARLSSKVFETILAAAFTGMTVETFRTETNKWIESAQHLRWKRLYTELAYQPMQQVINFLRARGYRTYIVTGSAQDFVRVFAERVYGIPPEQVIGSADATKYGYGADGKPVLALEPNAARRQFQRKAGGHLSDHRPASVRCVRQLDRGTGRCSNTPRQATARGSR
jgi:phosphoglycolate phosphatase-like HAD superfamily hydrolase